MIIMTTFEEYREHSKSQYLSTGCQEQLVKDLIRNNVVIKRSEEYVYFGMTRLITTCRYNETIKDKITTVKRLLSIEVLTMATKIESNSKLNLCK